MKVFNVIVCTLAVLAVKKTAGSAIGSPFYPLDPEDLSEGDVQELEYWNKYFHRQKRLAAPRLASAGLAVNIRTATVDGSEKKIIEIAPNSIPIALKPLHSHETIPIDSTPRSSSPSKRGVVPTSANFLFSGSAGAFKHLKTAFFTGIVSKIAGGSAAASGAASSAANSLKNVLISKVASGSAAASTGAAKHALTASGAVKLAKVASGSAKASTGFQTKVEQVSDDIAVSEADVKTQLRTAIEAGNDQNLGQAASGLAGAVAGAVGSASAGAGQLTRGVIEESTNLLNQAKLEILHENVIDEESDESVRRVRRSPAPFGHGSAAGVHQVKASIISALVNAVGQLTGASARTLTGASSQTVAGSAGGVHHLTKALFAKITGSVGQLATASVAGSSGAVAHASNAAKGLKTAALAQVTNQIGQASKGGLGVVSGSAGALHQLKSAAFAHLGNTVAKVAQGSVAASGQLAAGSAGAIDQAKNAVFSKVTGTVGQLATAAVGASSGASAQASSVANGLKEAAVSQLTNQIGLASKGTAAAVSGSAAAVHQLKSAVVSHVGQTVLKAAQGSAGTVAKVAQGSASAVAGTSASLSGAVNQVKTGAVKHVTSKIGQLAAGSASLATGASSAAAGAANAVKQLKTSAVKHAASASAAASGAITKGVGSASSAIHQAKVGALTQVHRKLRQVASDVAKTSHGAVAGVGNTISGSAKVVYDLKEAAVNVVQDQISNAAEASAEASGRRRKRSSSSSIFGHLTDEEEDLPKRSETTGSGSGSGDILNHFKSALISGLGQKIGQVAKGSAGAAAGASAGFSKGSSGGDSHPSYHHEEHEEDKGLDVWDLKKSVLNTLLQAVKAIKGGVLAIKGQLIKGSGYVVSGSGQLLASGGDKVTKLGKNIINNAVLVHPDKDHHHHHTHSDYSSHSSYTGPSAPSVGLYDAPLSSGLGHSSNYESPSLDHHHIKPYGSHAGILILRRVPHGDQYKSSHSHHHVDHAAAPPSFKPLPPTGPTFGTVVGKFFTASTSLDPRQPTAFTDADIHPYKHYYRQEHKEVEESHSNLSPPDPPHFDHSAEGGSPPATGYGAPFEHQSPTGSGLDDHLHGEASSISEDKVKLTKGELSDRFPAAPTLASSQVEVPKDAPESLQALQLSHGAHDHTLGPPFNSDYMAKNVHENFVTPKELLEPKESENLANFLPKNDDELSSQEEASNEMSINNKESYMRFVEQFPFPKAHPTIPSYPRRTSRKVRVVRHPAYNSYRTKGPAYRPDFSVVKSVSYEITPDGAKRLT